MPFGETTSQELERIATQIVDAAFKVHNKMGPGLLEHVYQECLKVELEMRGLKVRKEVDVPVIYEGVVLDCAFRIDLLVEECVIIEVKSVERMAPIFEAIVHNYLRLTKLRLAFLINFNVELFKNGIKRIVI